MFTLHISPSQELQFLMFFRFFQLVVSHPAFSKDEDLQKVLKEENVSFLNNKSTHYLPRRHMGSVVIIFF